MVDGEIKNWYSSKNLGSVSERNTIWWCATEVSAKDKAMVQDNLFKWENNGLISKVSI